MAGIMAGTAAVIAVVAGFGTHHPVLAPWALPPLAALGYAAAFAGLAVLVFRIRRGGTRGHVRLAVLALAGFLVITFAGVYTELRLRKSENTLAAMEQLKKQLPPGQQLVKLGHRLDSLFSYYYGLPIIASRPWPAPGTDPDPDLTYFCFQGSGDSQPQLPFAWEEIGVVCLDRNHHPIPEEFVTIGRRLPNGPAPGPTP
jgi:hypothetical protein